MQTAMETPSPSWLQILLGLASFLVGGTFVRLLTLYLNRKKPFAEIHETLARARKTNVEADVELNAIIERLHLRIDQMQSRVDELRSERNSLRDLTDQQQSELNSTDQQMKRMAAYLKMNDLQYPEAGPLKKVKILRNDE
mgnify:CR=1 FL=1